MEKVIKLRDEIEATMASLARQNRLSDKEIIQNLMIKSSALIASVQDELVNMALKTLIRSVGQRVRSARRFDDNLDLFDRFHGITPTLIVEEASASGEMIRRRRTITKSRFVDVEATLNARLHKPKRPSSRDLAMQEMLDQLRPYALSTETTIGEAYSALKEEEGT